MVALYRKQNSLDAVLQRQRELCQQLTQVASHHITNCLQSLVSQSHACTACRVRQKNHQKKSTPFGCHNESLLRWLVGVTLRAVYDVHLLQQ